MKRLFIAVEVPEKVQAIAAGTKAILENEISGARWVPPENVHLTLKFLGNCHDEQVEAIKTRLREDLADTIAFKSATTRFGAFPTRKKVRILWLGMEESQELTRVYERVSAALLKLGFEADARVFRPHITLARLKNPQSVDIESLDSKMDARQAVPVQGVTLFMSRLTPRGAEYESLAKIDLLAAKG